MYKYIAIWIFLIILFLAVSTVLTIYYVIIRQKKINAQTGFFVFKIDSTKNRIKIEGDINSINKIPKYLWKILSIDGQWAKLNNFLNIFDSGDKRLLLDNIKKKNFFKLKTKIAEESWSNYFSKVDIEFNNVVNDEIIGTFTWRDIDIKMDNVFNKEIHDLSYIPTIENYEGLFFFLNKKHITDINAFLDLFKDLGKQHNINGLEVVYEWNVLCILFNHDKLGIEKAKFLAQKFIDIAKLYNKLYFKLCWFDSYIMNKKTLDNVFTFFDYLKLETFEKNAYNFQKIPSNIWTEQNFQKFCLTYENIIYNLRNNFSISLKNISLKNAIGDKTELRRFGLPKIFNSLKLNKDYDYYLEFLDITRLFYNVFYEKIGELHPKNAILKISDSIFETLDINVIKKIGVEFPTFIQSIKLLSAERIKDISQKIVKLQGTKLNFCLEIKDIDSTIISLVSPWIKFIWIDEELTSRLTEPNIVLYLNTLLDNVKNLGIKVIFEKLDYKTYRKLFYKHTSIILYTTN
ncbi:hypothetical protein BRO51_02560 [Metamycoplasma hominis]|uniref:MHO_4530 family protein n=1 Tax=Metamycoplasma hominis TaxID=2098 RepID=UPI00093921DA|nr:hypothetical protein [Metamycoplasma hominis]MBD3898812.1 hypothetical protein [Metamycoplasma hominis]OKL23394.1 hypothetical protein BRO51_02560 [Metamycoplasma hominis]